MQQANIAHNQQINNGTPKELQKSPNELLEHEECERLDTGTATVPFGANQELETVGKVNGEKNSRGNQ